MARSPNPRTFTRARPPARGGRTADARDDADQAATTAAHHSAARLGPLAAAGNRAVAGVLSTAAMQRLPMSPGLTGVLAARALQRAPDKPGWDGSTGWNKGVREESGVNRVPIDGLTRGNQQDFSGDHTNKDKSIEHGRANEKAKTTESGAGRAVVLVPKGVSDKGPFSVLLHLHGYTSRSWDPYAGWRERQDGTVRDVALDRLEAQLAAAGDSQVVGILAQGVGHSEFGKLDPGPYIDEVLQRLTTVAKSAIPLPDPAKGYKLILSAHSGGGHTVRKVLDAERTAGGIAAAEVVLFDAINNGTERQAVTDWALGHLNRTLAAVASAGDDAAKDAAIAACPILRAYHGTTRLYVGTYGDLRTSIDTWFADASHQRALGGRLAALRDHFRIQALEGTGHEQTVRGIGNDPAGGPLADALSAYRDPSKASKLVTKQPAKPGAKSRRRAGTGAGTAKSAATKVTTASTVAEAPKPEQAAPPRRLPGPGEAVAEGAADGDFVHDFARTTIDLLPAAERAKYEAIAWIDLDYPGAKMKIKDVSEENLAKWRSTPGYEVFEVSGKAGPSWYLRGTHQDDAQRLLNALARVRPGGGERRPNLGKTALLSAAQYKKDPAAFDAYIASQLTDVTSYDRGDHTKTQTHSLNKHAAEKFAVMLKAAAADDVYLSINNSYRSRAKAAAGAAKADNAKAVAKYSAHSMGLAMDLNLWVAKLGKRADVSTAFGNVMKLLSTPGYKWMYQRGAEFGFFQYRNEPWHWEYNPEGFRDTFWNESPDLAPEPEPAAPAKKGRKK